MKGIPGAIFYHQIYYGDREDEVAYCADCDEELLTSDNEDESNLFLCPDCWALVSPSEVEWKEATKDSENNPPKWVHDYSAHYIIRQGSGNWENVKYRTEISGTVTEIGELQKALRVMSNRSAANLINIIANNKEALSYIESVPDTAKPEIIGQELVSILTHEKRSQE